MPEISDKVRKNLLDLNYNKHLQYQTTGIIVSLTFAVGVILALLTNQVDFKNPPKLILLGIVSFTIFSLLALLIKREYNLMSDILNEIKNLDF